MAISALLIGCDMDVTYSGASIAATGAYLNAATVTYAITDIEGDSVGSGTLAYVAASNGNYAGTIESTVTGNLIDGDPYVLTVTLVEGGYNDRRTIPMYAALRP